MATASSIADIARRLESEVERHGCDRLACDLCQDVEEALAPQPERHTSRPASVRRTGEHQAIPEGLARQDEAFAALPCY
jgi:hypothetical protein